MAYIDHTGDPRRRAVALTGVIAVHGALAIALLSLSVAVKREMAPAWNPFVLTPDPRPAIPPPPTTPVDPPAAVIVIPEARETMKPVEPDERVEGTSSVDGVGAGPLPSVRPYEPPPPAPIPTPGPSFTPKDPAPANAPGDWITARDYPARPLRDGIEGVAGYRLIVGSGGRVSSCEITQSTGNRQLDSATCGLLSSRARFEPATDRNGASVVGQYSGKVRWEIPD